MKTFRLIGMALLAIVLSVSFIACSSDNDDNNGSLVGTTWKVVSIDNAYHDDSEGLIGATGTLNADGTVTLNPKSDWTYSHWTLNDNTLKIVLGQGHPDDYVEGTISISGNSATWDCYWADVYGQWNHKDWTHIIVHLQKQ